MWPILVVIQIGRQRDAHRYSELRYVIKIEEESKCLMWNGIDYEETSLMMAFFWGEFIQSTSPRVSVPVVVIPSSAAMWCRRVLFTADVQKRARTPRGKWWPENKRRTSTKHACNERRRRRKPNGCSVFPQTRRWSTGWKRRTRHRIRFEDQKWAYLTTRGPHHHHYHHSVIRRESKIPNVLCVLSGRRHFSFSLFH